MNRRSFLRLSATGAVAPSLLVACNDEKKQPPATDDTSLSQVGGNIPSDLFVGAAQEEVLVGEKRYLIGLAQNEGRLVKAQVTIYAGTDVEKPPLLEAPAKALTGEAERLGLYLAEIEFPTAGDWFVAAVATASDGSKHKGGTKLVVVDKSVSPVKGDQAPVAATPTTARPIGADPLCSKRPAACSMHAISLDAAVRNGKPTVITFAAPAFCQSETCGPVVDIVETVSKGHLEHVNFIHVEAFWNDKTQLAPPLGPWKFVSEPWTYFLDKDGVVVDRLSGAVGTEEVEVRATALHSH